VHRPKKIASTKPTLVDKTREAFFFFLKYARQEGRPIATGCELGPEVGEPPGDGKEGAPMVTGGELGPEVGEPPGGGKEGVSMLTGNEPGRKAGEPPETWPSPKDNKAASALRSCSKKTKKRRKKGGDATRLMRPS
jgi:hypothetical protein